MLNIALIKQQVYSPNSQEGSITETVIIKNIPIQKWVNLIISVYGRTLDTYLDGKLVRTTLMQGTAKVSSTTDVILTPLGGFSGYTSKFQYWADATDPQNSWNIYEQGYDNSSFFGINQYEVKVSVLNNNVTTGSITV